MTSRTTPAKRGEQLAARGHTLESASKVLDAEYDDPDDVAIGLASWRAATELLAAASASFTGINYR